MGALYGAGVEAGMTADWGGIAGGRTVEPGMIVEQAPLYGKMSSYCREKYYNH